MAKVLSVTHYTVEQLFEKLRTVKLKGFNSFPIYEDAIFHYWKATNNTNDLTNIDLIIPTQRYVLSENILRLDALRTNILEGYGLDILDINGYIEFDLQLDSGEVKRIPLTPPIVEVEFYKKQNLPIEEGWDGDYSSKNSDSLFYILNDGMHRIHLARTLGVNLGFVLVETPEFRNYPYYAYPLANGWNDVESLSVLTEDYKKKEYRLAGDRYKELFRMLNDVFVGVQEKRETVKF